MDTAEKIAEEHVFKHVPGMDSAQNIETVYADSLTPKAFYSQYVAQNRPCLIKGAIKHWPAMEKWRSPEYLLEKCRDVPTPHYPHMNYESPERMGEGREVKPFHEVLEMLQSSDTGILSAPSVVLSEKPFDVLSTDTDGYPFLPNPKPPIAYPKSRAFMYKGAGTGWHFHVTDETLMSQVVGSKKVGLLPPDKLTDDLVFDAFKADAYLENGTCFDASRASQLKPYTAIVEPGDAMYIPPFWWHGVEPTDGNFGITVAQCWRSPLHVMGDLSYPTVRKIWKKGYSELGKVTFLITGLGIASLFAQAWRFISKPFRT
ncbi:cupin-like domain-containing protein [Vibrio penaeicida]|uniref:cupin-like domain-containing protein n=1 Tax=Vibrio penaeicida TaxID=104609 RepID=UPI000CEA6F6A|nr:cupin-like domain-containing protein [Vibrio penaeicida]